MILKKIKNRSSGWRPLVLHWRRRRVLRPILRTDRVTSLVSHSYFPQIHLHFTTHITNHNYRNAVPRSFFATTVKRDRVLVERRLERQIYADRTADRPLAHGPRIKYRSGASTPARQLTGATSEDLRSHVSSKQWTPIRKIHQPRPSASLSSPSLVLSPRRAKLTGVVQTNRHTHEYRTQTFSAKRETLVKSTQIYFDRAEELVWRRTSVIEDGSVVNVTETTQRPPALRTSAGPTTHTQSAPPANIQTTPQQLPKLDPGLLDRLTDDVIRRVEKRALIERQRRGL